MGIKLDGTMQTAISRIAEAGRIEKLMKTDALSLMFSKTGGGEGEEAVAPCNHADAGCEWKGTATERAKHLCQFDMVPCPHTALGCAHQEQRMYLEDHLPFCRCVPFKCPSCGRGGMFTSQFSAHVERECTTFHKYRKKTGDEPEENKVKGGRAGRRRSSGNGMNRAKRKENDKQWLFTWISKKHLNRAFDITGKFEAKQVDLRSDVKIGRAQEEMELRIDESAEQLGDTIAGLLEDEGPDNPYTWSIDKLLAFCDERKLRRVSKRKKQANLVQEFLARKANQAHEELVVREEGAYVEVETRWKNTCKQVRRLADSRRSAAAERFASATFQS